MRSSRFMVALFMVLALLAFAAQFLIDFTPDNIAASCVVLASSMAILLYILWTDAIQTHPLSTFAKFGLCFTSQLGALLAQSASGVSLTQNLRLPLETFVWLAVFQGTALLAHTLYRTFSGVKEHRRSSLIRVGLEQVGLYTPPSVGALWFLGLIGLFGQLLSSVSHGTLGKIGHGFEFVVWAPFLIPIFVAEVGPDFCDKKRHYPFLIVYIGLIAFIGLAANARGFMLSGLMTISIFFILRGMRSAQSVTASKVGKTVLLGLVVAGMAIPVSDLMVAMRIARNERATSSPMKMVEDTFYYVTQPELLDAQRTRDKLAFSQSSYDETYFANPLLGRLMETKFHDNAIYFASRISTNDGQRLWDITGDFLWTALPDPALTALRIDVDKEAMRFTIGDYLSYLSGAGELGGFKTGSAFGHGLAMFGIYFPLIYFFICCILFWAMDLLSYRTAKGQVLISALGMLGIWKLFQYGITNESLQGFFMVVRGLPQTILIYLLTLWIARRCANALARLLGASRRHPAPSGLAVR